MLLLTDAQPTEVVISIPWTDMIKLEVKQTRINFIQFLV